MKIPPLITALSMLCASALSSSAADSVVVFNEIHYHPADALSETEWIEFRNLMGVNVDMSAWEIEGGVNYTFAEGTIIPGHGFLLVAADPNNATLAGKNALGPFTGSLSNGGEEIRLVNNNDRTMDSVSYGDDNDWPVGADGSGATLAKLDQNTSDARPANWVASPEVGGTPGSANFPLAGQPPIVTSILTLSSNWMYRDASTAPPANWKDPSFDDSAWASGDGALYAGATQSTGAGEGLIDYWPLNENSGTSAPNAVAGANAASLFNGASWFNDGARGQVLTFDGVDAYVDAGTIPQMTTGNDFTWSFWAYNTQGTSTSVMLGNRYSPSGADFSPREFIKFTTAQFEFHRANTGENIAYAAIPTNSWIHHAVVKDGNAMTYYRDGVISGSVTISQGVNNPQPLYFGGDKTNENWAGRIDDVALWEKALPAASIAGIAEETFTPLTAPTVDGAGGGNLQTELTLGSSAYYFRKDFVYSGNPARTALTLQLLVDDGAVVYLNGVEVHRENMPAGVISHGTFAANAVTDATLTSGITIPATSLLQGNNTIAVEVHQASAGSPDMIFAAALSATETPPQPGEFAQDIVFSEISAANAGTFQVELTNVSGEPIDLTGYEIRSSAGAVQALSGVITSGAQIAISPSFIPANGDRLFLFRPGGVELADARGVTNRLRGLSGDDWLYPDVATFGAPNSFTFNNDIVINEIMYNPMPLQATPPPPGEVLIDWGATWRYNDKGANLGDTWETVSHAVDGVNWQSGPAPMGIESTVLPHPLATTLTFQTPRAITFYFETEFTLTAPQLANLASLEIIHQIDDGAIFYINGIEVRRFNMNAEPTNSATLANANVGDAGEVATTLDPAAKNALHAGVNRISVEVHQGTSGSSDVAFGMQLNATQAGLPFRKSDNQWIELYNRGSAPVNLKDWEFSDGILYTFLTDQIVQPGEYVVIDHTQWSGSLSRSGERLILRDPSKNIADEVRYADGGRWPEFADGGGSSIELRDPDSDNSAPEAWAASAEMSDWQTITYTGLGTSPGNDPTIYNEFIFGLLDTGTVLIDDVSVIENPSGTARELIQNGNFSGGTTSTWRMLGTHSHADIVPDPDNAGNMVMRVRATGATEHMSNHAETTFRNGGTYVTTSPTQTYQISFRVRWMGGSNQLNTRLYFNRLARTHILEATQDGGTPGAANSTAVANAGPTYAGLIHAPAVPEAGSTATVSVTAADPDGIASLTLRYSVNGAAYLSTAMANNGDGQFTAAIPGQSSGAKAQFYIEALDNLGAVSLFPAAGEESGTIIPWNDGQANLDYGDCQPNNFRIVLTNANIDLMHLATNVMSNDRLPATIIYNESDITYNAGVRLKGSEHGRAKDPRVGWNIAFPADQPFLGSHGTIAIDRSGAGDQFSQKEIMVKHAINHAGGGIPGIEDDLIRIIAPRSQHTGSAMMVKSRYDSEWLDNIYSNGGDGRMFEYELIYHLSTTTGGVEGLKLTQDGPVSGVGVTNLGNDKELHRWHWQIKNNRDADDFSGLMDFLSIMDLSGTAFRDATDANLDVDQWLRSFAVQVLFGIGDSYSSGSAHNAAFYIRPEDKKVMYFPWDMDFTFSTGATSSFTPSGDLTRLIAASPANERAYYGHLYDIVNTTFNTAYMTYWANHYSCFLPTENLASHLPYIDSRRTAALSAINAAVPTVPFQITTPDGTSTVTSTITLQGDAWVNVRELRIGSAVLELTWIDDNTWQATVPVAPGANSFVINAYDHQGKLISGATDTVSITGSGTIIPASAGKLVISELMYNPTAEAGEDADDYEFIELFNIDPANTLSLGGLQFINGITFTFPEMSLAPGARVVVARKQGSFQLRYGNGQNIAGEYAAADDSNKLSNGGEQITLVDALGGPISDFTFDDAAPWPIDADGVGYSLELVNPESAGTDPTLPISWRTSRSLGGNPGASDSDDLTAWAAANGIVDFSLDPDKDGHNHLAEFVFGSNPFVSDVSEISVMVTGNVLSAAVVIRNGADGVLIGAGRSADLITWEPATYLGRQNNDDGATSTLFFEATSPSVLEREFIRFEMIEE